MPLDTLGEVLPSAVALSVVEENPPFKKNVTGSTAKFFYVKISDEVENVTHTSNHVSKGQT